MFRLPASLSAVYRRLPAPARDWAATAYAWWSARRKYGPGFDTWTRFLEKSQWWDAAALRVYQQDQLRELFDWCVAESSYYRGTLTTAGWRPGASPWEVLGRLPIIQRAVVREQYAGIRTRAATDGQLVLTTSGTTGASLHVPHTVEALQREYAFRWQYYALGGAKRGDRFALFQGQGVVPLSQRQPPFWIRNRAENTLMFSLYHMDDSTLGDYVEALNQFAPQFLYGYPSGLYVIAAFAEARGLKLHPVRTVFSASEMLHPFQKEVIERMFQAPVHQWYGQVETTVNLQECEHRRLHVREEYGWLELLREDDSPAAPGEPARVVATGFGNRAFPLVRYDTGDRMELSAEERCPCGRGGRIIAAIHGRDDDFVITPEGRYVGRLDFVFKVLDTVREAQIVQEVLEELVVKVVPTSAFTAADEATIIRQLADRVGASMRIRVERVTEIPRGGGGKFRYVVSKVKRGTVAVNR